MENCVLNRILSHSLCTGKTAAVGHFIVSVADVALSESLGVSGECRENGFLRSPGDHEE